MIIYVMKNGTLDSHYVSGVTADGTVTLTDIIDAVEVWLDLPEGERKQACYAYKMKVLEQAKKYTRPEADEIARKIEGLMESHYANVYVIVSINHDDGADTKETLTRQRIARGEVC